MPTPGAYLLTLRLPKHTMGMIGKRSVDLASGWYLYSGSALGGLEGRLARHLRTDEIRHWHVDTLLANGRIVDIQTVKTPSGDAECQLAEQVRAVSEAIPVPAFGASDCACPSHLSHFHSRPGFSVFQGDVLPNIPEMFTWLGSLYDDYTSQPKDPFRTLITCILSLRTQDPVTHATAERLFSRISSPKELAAHSAEQLSEWIYPVGMYRQKARTIIDISEILIQEYNSSVPADVDVLTDLPGVGRKTANLVRSFAFNLPAVCVDTHVHRITNRWGLVRTANADDTEVELRRILPEAFWMPINPFLVQHGQQLCKPTRPKCSLCPLSSWCRYPDVLENMNLVGKLPGGPAHPTLKPVVPS